MVLDRGYSIRNATVVNLESDGFSNLHIGGRRIFNSHENSAKQSELSGLSSALSYAVIRNDDVRLDYSNFFMSCSLSLPLECSLSVSFPGLWFIDYTF